MFGAIFGAARAIGGAVAGAGRLVSRIPVVGSAVKALPGVGTALSVVGGISAASDLFSGGTRSPGLPALPGGGVAGQAGPGERSIFRNDPNVVAALKPYAIPMRGLRSYFRAPRGYVVVKDDVGDPMGIPKFLARQFKLWKPAKKPLLSIRDTSAIRRAGSAIKKLQNAEKMAKKIANWKSPPRREHDSKKGRK